MKYTEEELNILLEEAPKDEKGRPIISDEDFMDNLKSLPNKVVSDAGRMCVNHGYVNFLKKDDPRSFEIQSRGGMRNGEVYRERKRIAETIDLFLRKKDKDGVTMQDRIVEAMGLKAMDGCVGAAEFIRDTVGEKPSENVSVDVMTDGDKALMEKLLKRMGYDETGTTTE
jgi:hypothetical protein